MLITQFSTRILYTCFVHTYYYVCVYVFCSCILSIQQCLLSNDTLYLMHFIIHSSGYPRGCVYFGTHAVTPSFLPPVVHHKGVHRNFCKVKGASLKSPPPTPPPMRRKPLNIKKCFYNKALHMGRKGPYNNKKSPPNEYFLILFSRVASAYSCPIPGGRPCFLIVI